MRTTIPLTAASLVAKVSVEGDVEAKAKLLSVGKTNDEVSKGFTDKLGSAVTMGLLAAGTGIAALGISAVKAAGNFSAGLTSLVTGAGELPKNLGLVHDKMLQISTDTGTMTDQLVAGEYEINSAGQKGSQALLTLKDAAEGAKVGTADLGVVADATTTIMTDFAKQHITAAQAVNTLIATVSDGKTHMADLSASLAMILPTASAFGLHLQDISGAMATMTGESVPAADAATYLRQTIMSLESPGSKAVGVLKEIGLTSAQVSDSMKLSIPATLQLIEDHLSKKFPAGSADYMNALKDIAGGTKTFQGMLDLTGTHLGTFEGNVTDITDKVKAGGNAIVGWTAVQHDFNFQLDQTRAAFDAMLIKLGEELMPLVSTFLSNDVMPAIQHFQEWEGQTHGLENAFTDVVGVLGTLISDTEAVVSWFGKAGPQADILKVALLGVGGAIASIKMIEFGKNVLAVATDYGPKLINMLSGSTNSITSASKLASAGIAEIGPTAVTAEATAAATEPGFVDFFGQITGEAGVSAAAVKDIGAAADGASAEVKIASAGMETSLSGVLGALKGIGLGFAAFGAMGMVPDQIHVDPNSDVIKAYDKGMSIDQYEKWKNAQIDGGKQVKQQLDGINQAWRDMNALYDQYNNQVLGVLGQPNKIDSATLKVMEYKGQLDDVSHGVYLDGSMHPTIFTLLTKQEETAANQARLYRDQINEVTNAVDAYNTAIGFKGTPHQIDVSGYISHSGQDDTSGLGIQPGVGTRGFTGHASGILNNPVGHYAKTAEQGGEWMYMPTPGISYVPQGASIFPHGSGGPAAASGASATVHLHLNLEVDGHRFARGIMPNITDLIRNATGVRF